MLSANRSFKVLNTQFFQSILSRNKRKNKYLKIFISSSFDMLTNLVFSEHLVGLPSN